MTLPLDAALRELRRDEEALAAALVEAAERHPADPEVGYVARDLAEWSRRHAADLTGRPDDAAPELPALLAELRDLHQRIAGVALTWDIVIQAAQAKRDDALLALAQACRARTQRQLAWSKALVKANAAQLMTVPADG